MREIPLTRFNALAGYARQPMSRIVAEEGAWFEHPDGKVVGMLIRDREDGDFGGIVFAQDLKLRFRAVGVTRFYPTPEGAAEHLEREMEVAAAAEPEEHHQGDEEGRPVDFFAFARPSGKLHPDFIKLAEL